MAKGKWWIGDRSVTLKKGPKKTIKKRLAKVERKVAATVGRYSKNITLGVDPAASSIVPLSYIQEGDDYPDRSGNKIYATRISGILRFYNSAANLYTTTVRMLLIQDKQNNGAIPALNLDVLPSATSTSMTQETYYVNQARYRVLMDKHVVLSATHGLDRSNVVVKFNKKLNFPIHYLTPNADAAGQSKNGLYMVFISSTTTAAQFVSVDGWTNLRFNP